MSGDGDGNLSDSSCSAVSGLSLRDGGNQRQLVNPNLNLSISSTSGDAHDPKTREILRLRAENADLKRRLQDIDAFLEQTPNRSPRSSLMLRRFERALDNKELFDLTDKQAVALEPSILKFPDSDTQS